MKQLLYKLCPYLNPEYKSLSREIIHQTILNINLRLIKGTINDPVDYDDAWGCLLAQHSKIIFDVGANVGKSAILFLLSGSIDKIILIDTNPQALSMAAENLFLNNMARDAIFVPAFVSNKLGESIQFWTLGTGAAGSMYESHAVSAKKAGASFAVDTVTLDNLAEYYNLFPDFAKIDVEGAEALVLEGAIRVSETGCKFLVEMHSNPELSMETNASKVLAWCEKNSYHAWYLKNHSLLKSPETIKHRGRCHLLLLPVNLPFPSYLEGVEQGSALQERIS